MLACRRIQPLFVDFEWAFSRTKVPEKWREGELPFEELAHDLKIPFRPNSPPLLPTPPPDDHTPPSLDTLNMQRNGPPDRKKGLVPTSFPALPAEHAYRQSAVYPTREDDPRRIRELATEEGRMGEQALRRLAGATKMEAKVNLQEEARKIEKALDWGGKKPPSAESMFEKTMESIMMNEVEGRSKGEGRQEEVRFELGPIVNWERKFWMQPNVVVGKARDNAGLKAVSSKSKSKGADAMDLS